MAERVNRVRKGPLGALAGIGLVLAAGGALVITGGTPGCDQETARDVERVKIGGQTFFLELADAGDERLRGLSERTEIASDGGMLFVFPDEQVAVQNFVMRDCPIDIDIIYLDRNGRVVASHMMKAEPPRGEGEGEVGSTTNMAYERRLKKYSSKFPAQFVIELKGGTLPSLNIEEGQEIKLDLKRLKDQAN